MFPPGCPPKSETRLFVLFSAEMICTCVYHHHFCGGNIQNIQHLITSPPTHPTTHIIFYHSQIHYIVAHNTPRRVKNAEQATCPKPNMRKRHAANTEARQSVHKPSTRLLRTCHTWMFACNYSDADCRCHPMSSPSLPVCVWTFPSCWSSTNITLPHFAPQSPHTPHNK